MPGWNRPVLVGLFAMLTGCGSCPEDGNDVLFLGDSLLAWNEKSCRSLGAKIAVEADLAYTNAAVNGAAMIGGDDAIPNQHPLADFGQVVISGGANDLNGRCSCDDCATVMDRLVSEDGSQGLMPDLVDAWVGQGSEVLVLGYYPVKDGAWYGFDVCFDTITELDRRHALLAEQREGVGFFDLGDVLQPETASGAYAFDGVHPSPKGAKRLATAVAPLLTD